MNVRRLLAHVRARPRMTLCVLAGGAAGLAAPELGRVTSRLLLGWNVGVWLFLLLMYWNMLRADAHDLRRSATAQAEGAAVVLLLVVAAAVASVVATVIELAAAKAPGAPHATQHVLFTLATILGSWLLLPTLFALNYASLYYSHGGKPGGLAFPGADQTYQPNYVDFLYFSFTIAVAAQTADVSITLARMRRLVLAQALLAFVFNTTILAFTVNVGASLF